MCIYLLLAPCPWGLLCLLASPVVAASVAFNGVDRVEHANRRHQTRQRSLSAGRSDTSNTSELSSMLQRLVFNCNSYTKQ